jgi:hypothetical protein
VRRFETPRQLMAYLGLVPSERSTGEQVRRGSITKAGNPRARRVLGKPHQSALAPWIVQLVGTLPMSGAEPTCVPFMNQIATSPAVSRHRMSL